MRQGDAKNVLDISKLVDALLQNRTWDVIKIYLGRGFPQSAAGLGSFDVAMLG